jgi:hypothetical protein
MCRLPLLTLAMMWRCCRSHVEDLEVKHKQAIEMSISGDHDGALASLRFRGSPTLVLIFTSTIASQAPTAQYLNDLGVTYLRKVTLPMTFPVAPHQEVASVPDC